MINNDVLRSIRYMLDLSDHRIVDITRLADGGLRHRQEPRSRPCSSATTSPATPSAATACWRISSTAW